MAETGKTIDFNEYVMENIKALREENREFKRDINKRMDGLDKRMDGIERRMDRLDDGLRETNKKIDALNENFRTTVDDIRKENDRKIDALNENFRTTIDEIRKENRLLAETSQKEMRDSLRHSQILTSSVVSLVVVVLFTLLTH